MALAVSAEGIFTPECKYSKEGKLLMTGVAGCHRHDVLAFRRRRRSITITGTTEESNMIKMHLN
jgi:hypothetical protein